MIQISPQQFSSWAEPIEMLYACHQRVQRFCKQLQILPEYLDKNGCTLNAKVDIRQIITYFNIAAPLHHEDEEVDFFPALVKYYPQAQEVIDKLEMQHQQLHQNWENLSVQLEQLINEEIASVDAQLIDVFVQGYQTHIPLEETLFALGKQYIPSVELQAMGKIMAQRRKPQT